MHEKFFFELIHQCWTFLFNEGSRICNFIKMYIDFHEFNAKSIQNCKYSILDWSG